MQKILTISKYKGDIVDKFNIEDKGYSVTEVNKFVSDVIEQTESMLNKMKSVIEQQLSVVDEIEELKMEN